MRSDEQTDAPDNKAQPSGTPRWVKAFALIALVVVVLVVFLAVTGGGSHSPRRHIPLGETTPTRGTGGHTGPPAGVTHTQP